MTSKTGGITLTQDLCFYRERTEEELRALAISQCMIANGGKRKWDLLYEGHQEEQVLSWIAGYKYKSLSLGMPIEPTNPLFKSGAVPCSEAEAEVDVKKELLETEKILEEQAGHYLTKEYYKGLGFYDSKKGGKK